MNRVPAVRFKGFTDPWEQRKLGELGAISTGNTPSVTNDAYYSQLGVPWVTPTDIDGTSEIATIKCLSAEGLKVARTVPAGSILCTCIASIGKNAITSSTCSFNQQINALAPYTDDLDPYFLFTESALWSDYMKRNAAAGTMQIVNKTEFSEIETFIPQHEEQVRIAGIFRRLDNLITLHQRKHNQLTTLKKALLEKMFPKEGATEPEIRFSGFTDPWEQRKFSDFVVASGIKNRDNLPLQSYSVSNDRGFVPQDEQFENGGTMRDADKSMYWIVEPESFAYNPARINVGSIGYLSTSENVIVSSLYEVFRADETCDDRFLWHWFKSPLFMKQIEMLQEGGVRLYFFFDKLLLSEIWMPGVEEQRLIGAQFDCLDNLITLHQRKLEILRNLKTALLDKMFV